MHLDDNDEKFQNEQTTEQLNIQGIHLGNKHSSRAEQSGYSKID